MKDNQLSLEDRYERGMSTFDEVTGLSAMDFSASLADIAPRFARYVMEWEFADMIGESSLDARTREIVALASLATLGASGASVLKLRVGTALKAGVSREEIIDIFIQLGVAAGFPIALSAIQTAQAVFQGEEAVIHAPPSANPSV